MPYQLPKADHPWRKWVNGKYDIDELKKDKPEVHVKPVKIMVRELAQSWDKIEVYTYCYSREGRFLLNELPQAKQAAWLAGLLRKSYGQIQI